jgi:hypothetical protein
VLRPREECLYAPPTDRLMARRIPEGMYCGTACRSSSAVYERLNFVLYSFFI